MHVDLSGCFIYYFYSWWCSSCFMIILRNVPHCTICWGVFHAFRFGFTLLVPLYPCNLCVCIHIRFWVNCYYVITIIISKKTIVYYVTVRERDFSVEINDKENEMKEKPSRIKMLTSTKKNWLHEIHELLLFFSFRWISTIFCEKYSCSLVFGWNCTRFYMSMATDEISKLCVSSFHT